MMLTGNQVPTLVLVRKPELPTVLMLKPVPELPTALVWALVLRLEPLKTLVLKLVLPKMLVLPVWPPMLKPELPKMLPLLEPNSRRLEACDAVRPFAPRFGAS